jgi:hypothetical protein
MTPMPSIGAHDGSMEAADSDLKVFRASQR